MAVFSRFSRAEAAPSYTFRNTATVFCVLYAIALFLNVHPLAEGGWILYARALAHGTRLYADQHLALQPLFVLQTVLALKIFGNSWLLLKIPAFLEMLVYLIGIRWLVSKSSLIDWEQGLLIACTFTFSTLFDAFRFDDYHILTYCFVTYSLVLLLYLAESFSFGKSLGIMSLLGILSGSAITNRVNDGGMLFLTTGLAALFLISSARVIPIAAFIAVTALTNRFIVFLTGDTFSDYASSSIFHAAGSKGGLFQVLRTPAKFPFKTLKHLATKSIYRPGLLLDALLLWLLYLLLFKCRAKDGTISKSRIALFLTGIAVVSPLAFGRTDFAQSAVVLGGVWMLIAVALGAIVLVRAAGYLSGWRTALYGGANWSAREFLLLIPMGQLISASMSSGGLFPGLYPPVAILLALLPIASPFPISYRFVPGENAKTASDWLYWFLLSSAAIFFVATVAFKLRVPFSWHTYIEPPVFTERTWYRHPIYGPMYIRERQLSFITRVCHAVTNGDSRPELLSMPYTYANNFCGVDPWMGYAQTFFDTVSAETIRGLMAKLESAPPKWILYQRQLGILELHEVLFNSGHPLAHRLMDRQIMNHIESGAWTVVVDWNSFADPRLWNTVDNAHWMLIHTVK